MTFRLWRCFSVGQISKVDIAPCYTVSTTLQCTGVFTMIHNYTQSTQTLSIIKNIKKREEDALKKKVEISCKEERLSSKEQTKEAEDEFQDEKVNFKGLIKFTLMMSTTH